MITEKGPDMRKQLKPVAKFIARWPLTSGWVLFVAVSGGVAQAVSRAVGA